MVAQLLAVFSQSNPGITNLSKNTSLPPELTPSTSGLSSKNGTQKVIPPTKLKA